MGHLFLFLFSPKNYERELRRLADFMNLNITDETISEIAKKGTFKSVTEELKTDPKIMAFASKFNSEGSLLFYRKGKWASSWDYGTFHPP